MKNTFGAFSQKFRRGFERAFMKNLNHARGKVYQIGGKVQQGASKDTKAQVKYWEAYSALAKLMHDDPRVYCPCKGPLW